MGVCQNTETKRNATNKKLKIFDQITALHERTEVTTKITALIKLQREQSGEEQELTLLCSSLFDGGLPLVAAGRTPEAGGESKQGGVSNKSETC